MNSISLAKKTRIESLKMVNRISGSHIGSALSMTDILAVLYSDILKVDSANPDLETRDRLILSKGHACSSLYACLALKGFFNDEDTLNEIVSSDLNEILSEYPTKGILVIY